jgi:hypothetical protein
MEMENEFFSITGKMPTLSQSTAYWTMVQVMDLDYTILNMGISAGKSRQGYQMIGFNGLEPTVEGRVLTKMPDRAADWNYGIIDKVAIWIDNYVRRMIPFPYLVAPVR